MKRVLLCGLLTTIILFTGGCGDEDVTNNKKADDNKKENVVKEESSKNIHCTLSTENNGVSLNSEYTIHVNGKYADKVETLETVNVSSDELANVYKSYFENTYNAMNDSYGGYDINVSIDGTKVTSDTTIDYTKMNIEQLAKDDSSINSIVENGKIKADGLRSVYETMGANCK